MIEWSLLLALAAAVHVYFIPMCAIFLGCNMLYKMWKERSSMKKVFSILLLTAVPIMAAAAVLWVLGAFYGSVPYDSGGYGEGSANLNFLFNSLGKSGFVPALPHPYIKWVEEGFGYLGIGGLTLLGVGLLRLVFDRSFRSSVWECRLRLFVTVILLCICVWLATNPEVIWNEYPLFRWVVPKGIEALLRIFRALGRFVWPVCYILLLFGIVSAGCQKGTWRYLGAGLLSVCLVIQLAEFRGYLAGRAGETRLLSGYRDLDADRLDQAAGRYEHIYSFDYDNWQDVAVYGGTHRLTLNQTYLSRVDWQAVFADAAMEEERLWRGESRSDTLYLFPLGWEMENWPQIFPNLYLYKNSGFYIGSREPIESLQEFQIQ